MRAMFSVTVASVMIFAMTAHAQHHHHHAGDYAVGWNGDGNDPRLVFEGPAEIDLDVTTSPFLTGWSAGEPGFDVIGEAEPDEGIYVMPSNSNVDIALEIVSIDAGLWLFKHALASGPYDGAGEQLPLGSWDLHSHPVWNVPFDATPQETYLLTFKLVDRGGVYGESEPFDVSFEIVPEPTSMALVGMGVMMLAMRRRRA